VAADGSLLATRADIQDGQNVWQSIGGQEVGSIWGHGAYVAPDWSADWLHRESLILLDGMAQRQFEAEYGRLDAAQQAALDAALREGLRRNTYDPASGTLTISDERALAFHQLQAYYGALFGPADEFDAAQAAVADGGLSLSELRSSYAIPKNSIP